MGRVKLQRRNEARPCVDRVRLDQRGQPTRRWTSSNVPKANGAWVTTMAVDTCNDVYNEYEEYLVSTLPTSCWTHQEEDGTWKESCSIHGTVMEVCAKGFNFCRVGVDIPDGVQGRPKQQNGDSASEL